MWGWGNDFLARREFYLKREEVGRRAQVLLKIQKLIKTLDKLCHTVLHNIKTKMFVFLNLY